MAELTGRHVLGITVGAFAVIISVNLLLAYKAVSTFPGLEVKNSYVASQDFDRDRVAQEALGWVLTPAYDAAAGQMSLTFADKAGLPVMLQSLDVLVGRATEAADDSHPVFVREAGTYLAPLQLAQGKWMLQIEARATDGTLFRQRIDLLVKG